MKNFRPFTIVLLLSISFILVAEEFSIENILLTEGSPRDKSEIKSLKKPVTITHDKIFLYVDWQGVKVGNKYCFKWYSNGKLVNTYEKKREANTNGKTWHGVSISDIYKHGHGLWEVKFYFNDVLYYTDKFEVKDPGDYDYLYYMPENGIPENGILLGVHSTSYDPLGYFQYLRPMARENNILLLVPYFPDEDFYYQVLFYKEERADLYLNSIIEEAAKKTGADKTKLYMYGHSGGGQYSHRYLMAYPENIEKIVISAPGHWTFPYKHVAYPFGIGGILPADISYNLESIFAIPKLVIVGELDIEKSGEPAIWQGFNRVEKAGHWVNTIQHEAFKKGLNGNTRFTIIPDASHSVRGESYDEIENFLFGINSSPQIYASFSAIFGNKPEKHVELTISAVSEVGCADIEAGLDINSLKKIDNIVWEGNPGSLQETKATIPVSFAGQKAIFIRIQDKSGHWSDYLAEVVTTTTFDENELFQSLVGLWEFEKKDNLLKATMGEDLQLFGEHFIAEGKTDKDGAVTIGQGSYYSTPLRINTANRNRYTIVFDIKVNSIDIWHSLFQTNENNSNDSELFIKGRSGRIGVGATGYAQYCAVPGEWFALAVVVDNNVGIYNYYMNNELILRGTPQKVDSRFSLGEKALFFSDNDGEDGAITVSRIALYN